MPDFSLHKAIEAQIAAEYDKAAPKCPGCGAEMRFLARFGDKIVWECSKCDEQLWETEVEFQKRIQGD